MDKSSVKNICVNLEPLSEEEIFKWVQPKVLPAFQGKPQPEEEGTSALGSQDVPQIEAGSLSAHRSAVVPSSRPPKDLEELEAGMFVKPTPPPNPNEPPAIPKLKISRSKIFMDMMTTYYENLKEKERNRLTARRLKWRALSVAARLGLDYDKLPLSWVNDLKGRTGMKLLRRKKAQMDSHLLKNLHLERVRAAIEAGKCTVAVDQDLSHLPPPPEWIEAYAKGICPPRKLTFQKDTNGQNVLFYDYNPQLVEQETKYAYDVHDGNGVELFDI